MSILLFRNLTVKMSPYCYRWWYDFCPIAQHDLVAWNIIKSSIFSSLSKKQKWKFFFCFCIRISIFNVFFLFYFQILLLWKKKKNKNEPQIKKYSKNNIRIIHSPKPPTNNITLTLFVIINHLMNGHQFCTHFSFISVNKHTNWLLLSENKRQEKINK